jgi:hypothetical protein
MPKMDPVCAEIIKSDLYFAIEQMQDAARKSRELLSKLDELETEALLAFKDEPFADDGNPDKVLMSSYAAADEASERLAMVVATHK